MARSPIEIAIASETGAFRKGVESGIIAPLEDAEKQLEELGRTRGPEELERELKDAQKQTERLGDETRDTARQIEREFKDSYRSAKRSADDGLDGMSAKAREVGDELRGNLGETFSSFRGDLEDLPQIAQDTLGGLAGSGALGGIPGLVATAAGAAGLGMLIGAFEKIGDEQEALKEQAREWANTYIEEGGRVLSMSTIIANTQNVLNERYDEAATNSENWGVSMETAVAAMAGSSSAIAEVTAAVEAQEAAFKDQADAAANANDVRSQGLQYLTEEYQSATRGRDALDQLTTAMERGGQQADIYSRVLADQARKTEGATERLDEFGDTIISLPGGKEVYIDAETKQATMNVDAIEKKIYGVPDEVRSRVVVDVDDSAWRNWKPGTKVGRVDARVGGRDAYHWE